MFKVVPNNTPAFKLVYSECLDFCMFVSLYILTDCLSRRVYMLMYVSVCVCLPVGVCLCVSPVSLSPLPRWANGADHCGNHGGAPSVATGDERLHYHLWTA